MQDACLYSGERERQPLGGFFSNLAHVCSTSGKIFEYGVMTFQPIRGLNFGEIFDPQIIGSHLATFTKNCFPAIFGGHLDFCVKCKNAFIPETLRDRVILAEIFLTLGYPHTYWRLFSKSSSRHILRPS